VVVLLKCGSEEQYPEDIIQFYKQLYYSALQGTTVRDGGFLEISTSGDDRPFLGDAANTGFVFSRYCGQLLTGVPIPQTPHLFAILTRGAEITLAKYFASRLLLRLGYKFQSE